MTQLKNRCRFLLIGVLLLITVLPKDVARADVGLPPVYPGYSLSPGDLATNVQLVSEVVEIVIQEDSFAALVSATITSANPTETAAAVESPASNISPSFTLIMGILFIVTAGVLIIVAVKRREK